MEYIVTFNMENLAKEYLNDFSSDGEEIFYGWSKDVKKASALSCEQLILVINFFIRAVGNFRFQIETIA